jgi:hypothetical protein
MTNETNRLAELAVTIRADIGRVREMLDEAEQCIDRGQVSREGFCPRWVGWMELSKVLYKAQSALMAPASMAFEEAKSK